MYDTNLTNKLCCFNVKTAKFLVFGLNNGFKKRFESRLPCQNVLQNARRFLFYINTQNERTDQSPFVIKL